MLRGDAWFALPTDSDVVVPVMARVLNVSEEEAEEVYNKEIRSPSLIERVYLKKPDQPGGEDLATN